MRESRKVFEDWVDGGRPPKGTSAHMRMREAKSAVIAGLRQLEASERNSFYRKLVENPSDKEVYQLINFQRSSNSKLPYVINDGFDEIHGLVSQAEVSACLTLSDVSQPPLAKTKTLMMIVYIK